GLPHVAFLMLGTMTAGLAYVLWNQKQEAARLKNLPKKKDPATSSGTESVDSVTPPDLLELHVGYGLVPFVDQA
ncbi:MAG: hypothetical protein KC584_04810, partial [Nitrospira sp.]|nr:hypothetical protein [Nitrospira sp.]